MRKIVLLSVLCICAAFTALAQGAPQIMVDCSSLKNSSRMPFTMNGF